MEILLLLFLWLFPFQSPGDAQGRAAVGPRDPPAEEVWVEGHRPYAHRGSSLEALPCSSRGAPAVGMRQLHFFATCLIFL